MILEEIFTLDESSGSSLDGSFTRDLVFSKLWLLQELAKIQPQISTMYILGAWYCNLALFVDRYQQVKVDKIINVETDREFLSTGKSLLDQAGADNVEYMQADANDIDYRQLGSNGVVVNTTAVITAALMEEPIPEVPYTLTHMAADAMGVLDGLGIAKAHVMGASMGGMIAQTVAIEHPHRVLSLTSVMSQPGEPEVGQRHA